MTARVRQSNSTSRITQYARARTKRSNVSLRSYPDEPIRKSPKFLFLSTSPPPSRTLFFFFLMIRRPPSPPLFPYPPLSRSDLQSAGAGPGDLLVATEGGARLISIHCAPACAKVDVVSTATRAHGEGHIAFRVNAPPTSPSPSLRPTPSAPQGNPVSSSASLPIALIAVIAALVVLGVAVLAVVAVRRGGAGGCQCGGGASPPRYS